MAKTYKKIDSETLEITVTDDTPRIYLKKKDEIEFNKALVEARLAELNAELDALK